MRLRRVLGGESVRVRACLPATPAPDPPTEFQARLLQMVEADTSIGEVVIRSRRSAYDVYLALHRLLEAGRLEIVTGKAEPADGSRRCSI